MAKTKTKPRVPGSEWRLLTNEDGKRVVDAQNQGIFDELVVDDWLHIEQMDTNKWWMRIGDVEVRVEVVGKKNAPIVSVSRQSDAIIEMPSLNRRRGDLVLQSVL